MKVPSVSYPVTASESCLSPIKRRSFIGEVRAGPIAPRPVGMSGRLRTWRKHTLSSSLWISTTFTALYEVEKLGLVKKALK